jgi:hypothetical protein
VSAAAARRLPARDDARLVVGRIGALAGVAAEAAAARPAPVGTPRPVPVLDALAVALGRGLAWALVPRRPAPAAVESCAPVPSVVPSAGRAPAPGPRAGARRRARLQLVRGTRDGRLTASRPPGPPASAAASGR